MNAAQPLGKYLPPLNAAGRAYLALFRGLEALDERVARLQALATPDDDPHLAPALSAFRWQLATMEAALRSTAPLAVELNEREPIDLDALAARFGMVRDVPPEAPPAAPAGRRRQAAGVESLDRAGRVTLAVLRGLTSIEGRVGSLQRLPAPRHEDPGEYADFLQALRWQVRNGAAQLRGFAPDVVEVEFGLGAADDPVPPTAPDAIAEAPAGPALDARD